MQCIITEKNSNQMMKERKSLKTHKQQIQRNTQVEPRWAQPTTSIIHQSTDKALRLCVIESDI